MLDISKIKKIMMLSTSDSDGEALCALRKAQAMIASAKMTWDEIINIAESEKCNVGHEASEDVPWEQVIEACLDNVQGSAHDFIESLADQYRSRGSLSPRQKESLLKFYRNIRR